MKGIHKLIQLCVFTILIPLSSCVLDKNQIVVTLKKKPKAESLNVTVSNIQVINHQIIITGNNLANINSFSIKEGASTTNLQIASQSNTSLVANTLADVTLAAGKIFDFVLSSANATATFTVDFSLCDSTLGGKGINCLTPPNDKEVLSYDAASGKWKPRTVNGLSYQGSWDASTGSFPTTTTPGDYFIVTVAGNGYAAGDWAVFNGSTFDQISNANFITNVFGRTGAVAAVKGDYVLTKMGDVDLITTPPVLGNILKYNGTNWIPGSVSGVGTVTNVAGSAPIVVTNGASTPSISLAQASASADGYLSSTDWTTFNNKAADLSAGTTAQYYRGDKSWQTLNTLAVAENTNLYFTNARVLGVPLTGFSTATGAVVATDNVLEGFGKLQGQINLKANAASFIDWSVAGIQTIHPSRLNLLANSFAVATDTGGQLVASPTTAAELGYLSGVTSSVQTQIAAKEPAITGGAATQYIRGNKSLSIFANDVLATTLTGLSTATNSAISSLDSMLVALGKLQSQITNNGIWSKNGSNIYYAIGNVGIGTSTPSAPLNMVTSSTITSGSGDGVNILLASSPATASSASISGGRFSVLQTTSSNQTGVLQAIDGTTAIAGIATGTYSNVIGISATVNNTGSATITTAQGLKSSISNSATTTMTTSYELFLSTVNLGTITNQYGVYQSTSGSRNYFAGSVGVGVTVPTEKLHVIGNILASGTVTGSSDRRLKKEIRPIENALEKLDSITGVKYLWINPKEHNEGEQIGVIAQDVEKVFPQAVLNGSDGFKSVSYMGLVAPVIQAIKELHHKWFNDSNDLHREIASLKNENILLKESNEKMDHKIVEIEARLEQLEKKMK